VKLIFATVCLGTALGCQAAEPSRFTEKCNTLPETQLILQGSQAFRDALVAVVADPARDPDLFRRLWEPKSTGREGWVMDPSRRYVVVDFDPRQDLVQINAEIRADPVLATRGLLYTEMNASGCFGSCQYASATITEYHNVILDHYFLSSSTEENASIDSGTAGPGWQRTGESFSAYAPTQSLKRVHRFYGPSARSHFYTPDPQECGLVRKAGTGWLYEGVAFDVAGGYFETVNGACAYGRPVWRLYNNREGQNDPNHRYVTKQSLVDEMKARGWALEGVAFCLNN
jgi:hypothetical protein